MRENFFNQLGDVMEGVTMSLRIDYRKRRNARRYILRINARGDGGCVTIPRDGSWKDARNFARRNLLWLEDRLKKWQARAAAPVDESKILFRGEWVPLAETSPGEVSLGGQAFRLRTDQGSLISRVRAMLWSLARNEFPARLNELAALHQLTVKRVAVRNQRSRWGSCSVKAVISLNWRLIQAPEFVRDYVMVHELMHLREMNHSARFWKHVSNAFPRMDEAERWLKKNAAILRQ